MSPRSRYASQVDLSQNNTAHALIVGLVGCDKRVLDVGCAEGDVARTLAERGCTVSGVEYDTDAAERARPDLEKLVVGDVATIDLAAEFGAAVFDVVVFGDVLEHLADPAAVLRRARELLAPGGYLVISIPNVAHAAVRLSLLLGSWDYRPTGLLDETHLRFFTRSSLMAMLDQTGFVPLEVQQTIFGPFDTEIPVPRERLPTEVVDAVLQDPDARTYQFVLTAAPDDADGRLRQLVADHRMMRERYWGLGEDLAQVRDALARAQEEMEELRRRSQSQQDDLRRRVAAAEREVVAQLEARDREVEQMRREAQEAVAQLEARDRQVEQMRREVERLAHQLGQSTTLLRREERAIMKPVLRRIYAGARQVGRSLSPESQHRMRARLAPIASRVAPHSAQADAYARAAGSAPAAPLNSAVVRRVAAVADHAAPLPPGCEGAFDVVVMPVIDWHFRLQRPQHLATELSRLGHRVIYLTTEFDRLRAGGDAYSVLEQVTERVWIARLNCPPPLPRIYRDPLAPHQVTALAESMQVLVHELGLHRVVLLAQHPFWEPVLWANGQHLLAYDLMDDHAGFDGTEPWVIDAERRLVQGVDLVTTTAQSLGARAAGSVVVRNAAEVDRFADPPAVVHRTGRPTVGYFGAIAHWFDTGLVERCARAHPEWDFVLIGSTEGAVTVSLRELRNVRLLGELRYDELPSHLHGWDVCLIPFHVIPLTEHTNPVKAYEYLSAGKPVVATDMPEVRLMAPHVHVASDPAEFLAALETAMTEADDAELAERRRSWARDQTWAARAAVVEREVDARTPRASVVVLCYNNLEFTRGCLASVDRLSEYPNLEIVVVDNASTDGTREFLQEWSHGRSDVRLVLNEDNLGFAGGNNAGMSAATGDVLVLLNNDTVVTEGWLLGLVRHLRDDKRLGLVGPVTNNIGNEAKVDVAYNDMEEMHEVARSYTSHRFRQLLSVPTVAFFCVAMRREIYEQVGGLDEAFGVGFFEDDDYCRRVEAAGYDIAIAEDVFIHHHLSASFDALGMARKQELFEKNKAVYEAKWGKWTPHVYRAGDRR